MKQDFDNELMTAQIIASFGRRFIVRTNDGKNYEATTRKKRIDFACGDKVHIKHINLHQVVIIDYLPRRSLLYRQDAMRSKLIAANVTLMLIVVAAVPKPNEILLQRALLAAEAAEIQPVIVLNKADLPENVAWLEKFSFYQSLGYELINISALCDTAQLRNRLLNECAILLGQSGVGKSTLTNTLVGTAKARIGDLSVALDSGRHTTTHTQLYDLDNDSQLIDSPGLQTFGLHNLQMTNLLHYFPDMQSYIGKCRFHNCCHRQEPGCALVQAVNEHIIKPERFRFLQNITNELTR